MAAATEATDSRRDFVIGDRRCVSVKLTAPADGDTYDTGLYKIDNVQITWCSTTIAAADAVGANSVSGGTITFEVAGTARDFYLLVIGK